MTIVTISPFLSQYNSEDRPPPHKFLSIQSIPTSSFRPGFSGLPPTIAGPSGLPSRYTAGDASTGASIGSSDVGGFGNFGTGMGIGGQSWKAAGAKKA